MLVLLCGTAFSGKTTLAIQLHEREAFTIVSADWIHGEWGNEQPISDEQWAAVHKEVLARAERLLSNGSRVVIDDTSCYRFLRDDFRNLARRTGVDFRLVVLRIDSEEVLRRLAGNRQNPNRHDVPDDIIARHLATFEWPAEDESPLMIDARMSAEDVYQAICSQLL